MGLPRNTVGIFYTLFIYFCLISWINGAARFTVVPPSVLYVSVGETAKLVWDYTVDDRYEEFQVFSPMWNFYHDNGSAFLIAYENAFTKQEWSINIHSCPARLLNPVRVSKESTATLVIHNVTLADSGSYGCVLVLKTRSPITSKVKLIVTSFSVPSNYHLPMRAAYPKTMSLTQTSSGHDSNSRKKSGKSSSSTPYFQGGTFATFHLIVTSISVVWNIIMTGLVCYMIKKTDFKGFGKNPENQSVLRLQEALAINTGIQDGIEMEPREPEVSNSTHEPLNLIPPNINAVSRESTLPLSDSMGPEEIQCPTGQPFVSGTQHLYEQMNDGAPMSGVHEYQPLERNEGPGSHPNLPSMMTQEDAAADITRQQESSEYHMLHLYSDIK